MEKEFLISKERYIMVQKLYILGIALFCISLIELTLISAPLINNPNLPIVQPPTQTTSTVNNFNGSANNTNCWQGLCNTPSSYFWTTNSTQNINVTKYGNINFGDNLQNPSMDINNRYLYNSNGAEILDWENNILSGGWSADSFGAGSLTGGNIVAISDLSTLSIKSDSSDSNPTIDVSNGQLVDRSTGQGTLFWKTGLLKNDSGAETMNWFNRNLDGNWTEDGTALCLANGTNCKAGSMNYTNIALINQSNTFNASQIIIGNLNITDNSSTNSNVQYSFNSTDNSNPSYTNIEGTGNRLSTISVSSSPATSVHIPSILVDGYLPLTTNDGNGLYFNNGDNTGFYINFDFGSGNYKRITEVTIYCQASHDWKNWKFQASNDNSTWTDVSPSADLSSTTQTMVITLNSSIGYRYYRILGTGGTPATFYWYEFQFKIDDYGARNILQTYTNGTAEGILYLQSKGGAVNLNNKVQIDATGSANLNAPWNFLGGMTSDAPTFVVDSVNHLVGINTSAPRFPLETKGLITSTYASDAQGTLQLGNAGSSQWAKLDFNDAGNNYLDIITGYNSGSNLIRIKPANTIVATFSTGNGLQLGTYPLSSVTTINATNTINTQTNFSVNNKQGITKNIQIVTVANPLGCWTNYTGGILTSSDCS